MTKSTITRERLQEIAEDGFLKHGESKVLARMALSALDSEPHTGDELSNLLWYSQEATCHSDPNYYCEFQRLATPGLIAGIIRELQERRKVDSEPVAWTWHYREQWHVTNDKCRAEFVAKDGDVAVLPLYRHAQPVPVVPEEKSIPNTLSMYAVDAVAAIAEVKGWNACRATMLQAGNSPVIPDAWIPVSERLPEEGGRYWCYVEEQNSLGKSHYQWNCSWNGAVWSDEALTGRVTHWKLLPAAPQEPKS